MSEFVLTRAFLIAAPFKHQFYRQNTVHVTSHGIVAVNIEKMKSFAASTYMERRSYDHINFKMTFQLENGTDIVCYPFVS